MSQRNGFRWLVLALLASTAIPLSAYAAVEPSGTAVRVLPAASASGTEGERTLKAPGDIFQGDLITTGPDGNVQIRFLDNTRFVVGPNSSTTIDEFVFNNNGKASDVTFAAVRGTFRFIGGNSGPGVYSIRTPTATIGIRGTATDFTVLRNGEAMFYWQHGTGDICVVPLGAAPNSPRSECRVVTAGDFVDAPPTGGFANLSPSQIAARIRDYMPYVNSQRGLAPEFRLASAERPSPAPPPNLSPSPSNYR